jgi:VWFA-related protein
MFAVWAPLPVRAQSGVDGAAPVYQPKSAQNPPAAPQTGAPAGAQSASQAQPSIRVQSILVTTPVTVINRNGDFVSDLDEKEFKVFDNGVPQPIQRFEIASEPIAMVILVQTDNTMASLLYQVRGIGPVFSDLLAGPDGHIAVIGFADKVSLLQDFSNNRDQLKATLGQLDAFGLKAHLNDALMQAMRMLETRPETERRIIVAFSEGVDRGSENDKADVIRRATTDEITIYGMHLSRAEAALRQPPEQHPMDPLNANVTRPQPPGTVPTATNADKVWGTPIQGVPILTAAGETISSEFLKNTLEYYAGFTGGVYYSHWSSTKLQDQLDRIGDEVHSQYEIAYRPTTLAQTGFHRIDVEVEKPDLKLRARAGYFYQPR